MDENKPAMEVGNKAEQQAAHWSKVEGSVNHETAEPAWDGSFTSPRSKGVWPKDAEPDVTGLQPESVQPGQTTDGIPYSETERGSAILTEQTLNWNSGMVTMHPAYVPSTAFPGGASGHVTSPPRLEQGLSGVDAIVSGWNRNGRW